MSVGRDHFEIGDVGGYGKDLRPKSLLHRIVCMTKAVIGGVSEYLDVSDVTSPGTVDASRSNDDAEL